MMMQSHWTPRWRNAAAQFALGAAALALTTLVCFQLGIALATTGFSYVIVIALASLLGSFPASVALSLAAAACLNFFFAPPLFTFRIDYPEDIASLAAFAITSLIVTALTTRVRKAAEAARAAQQTLIDTIPAMVWSALPDGRLDFHNGRSVEFTGLSAPEIGDGWVSLIHPEDRANTVESWRAAVLTGTPAEIETRARNANGEYRTLLVRAAPLRDATGTVVKWYGVSADVEDRRRATEALRASEEQWREVFEYTPLMYFMIDPAGTVLSVNGFGAAQLGYTAAELTGLSVFALFMEDDRQSVRRNLASCLGAPGQSHSWQVRKLRKDGTVLWVRENAKAVRRGDRTIILVACEDVTERKRAADALRHSEMHLAEAQRLSRTGSFGFSKKPGKHIWSDEMFRIFELDRPRHPDYLAAFVDHAPRMRSIVRRIHPDDRALVRRLTRLSVDSMECENRLLMSSGAVKHLRVIVHRVSDPGNNPQFVGAVMDVTAAKRSEEELKDAQTELARASRVMMLGELTAAIAHEVSQPLTGMVSSGHACQRWLTNEPPDLDAAGRAVGRMVRDARRAGEVISRIRALVKKSPARQDRLDVNDAVTDVISLVRSEIERNRVALKTKLAADLPAVLVDRVQLQQVILNLVINANEAMSTALDGPRELVITSGRGSENDVLLTVRDSGAGFDGTKLESIFEAFYTTKPDGMGIGLAVSRTIIQAHGGKLWAMPNEPRGAVFLFTLPACERGHDEASSGRSP